MFKEIILKQGNTEIIISVIRTQRKSIGLEINPDLSVKIRVPLKLSDKSVYKVVEEKREWIFSKYKLISEREVISYNNGDKIPFGDKFIIINIIRQGDKDKVVIKTRKDNDEQLYLLLYTLTESQKIIRDALISYYKNHAKTVLNNKVNYFSCRMGLLANRITIRDQKTRWGSCSGKGNLNFNWRIIMMPDKVLDYVVLHELIHLKHMNHSKDFWAELEKFLPDYKKRRLWLKHYGSDYQKY